MRFRKQARDLPETSHAVQTHTLSSVLKDGRQQRGVASRETVTNDRRLNQQGGGVMRNGVAVGGVASGDEGKGGPNFVFDTGWAWMVAAGCFVVWFVTSSYHYAISVLLIDITEEFGVSVTMVTAMMAGMHFMYCLSTQILANLLLPFTSTRILALASAFIYAMCTLPIIFTSSFPVFIVSSLIKYTVVGGMCVPSLVVIGPYFQRYRSFAIGVSLLGMSGSAMIVPPLTRYLIEEYGFRGSFLILCGYEVILPTHSFSESITMKARASLCMVTGEHLENSVNALTMKNEMF